MIATQTRSKHHWKRPPARACSSATKLAVFTDTQRQHAVAVTAIKAPLSPAAVFPPQKKGALSVQAFQGGRVHPPGLPHIRLNTGGGGGAIVEALPGGDSVPKRRWGLKSGAVTCQTAGMLMPWLHNWI